MAVLALAPDPKGPGAQNDVLIQPSECFDPRRSLSATRAHYGGSMTSSSAKPNGPIRSLTAYSCLFIPSSNMQGLHGITFGGGSPSCTLRVNMLFVRRFHAQLVHATNRERRDIRESMK